MSKAIAQSLIIARAQAQYDNSVRQAKRSYYTRYHARALFNAMKGIRSRHSITVKKDLSRGYFIDIVKALTGKEVL